MKMNAKEPEKYCLGTFWARFCFFWLVQPIPNISLPFFISSSSWKDVMAKEELKDDKLKGVELSNSNDAVAKGK